MTTNPTTTPEMKTVDEAALTGPQVILIDNVGLPADKRCVRCEAQAYVEVEVFDNVDRKMRRLEFCAHHYTEHEPKLKETASRIVDYRPFLHRNEKALATH